MENKRQNAHGEFYYLFAILLICNRQLLLCAQSQLKLEIYENATIGTTVGYLNGRNTSGARVLTRPAFLIVHPPENEIDDTFTIDQFTGEIRTKKLLDYETKKSYVFLAIPTDGSSSGKRVTIDVQDVNDNAPEFPTKFAEIQLSEATKINSEIPLTPAVDRDTGTFGVIRYEIVSGNVNDTFGLSYDKDGINTYLNLIVNFELDREAIDEYILIIKCWDGGKPPMTSQMQVNLTILDINDNQPIFDQNEYQGKFSPKSRIAEEIIRVTATDRDIGLNSQIEYSLVDSNTMTSDYFQIDKNTGSISLKVKSLPDTMQYYELIVLAKDKGAPTSLYSTSVVKLYRQQNSEENFVTVEFFDQFKNALVAEDTPVGTRIATLNISSDFIAFESANFTLLDSNQKFSIRNDANRVYSLVISQSLDRETKDKYNLHLVSYHLPTNQTFNISFLITISDINDNEPSFSRPEYETNLNENAAPGASVFKMIASDPDEGSNGLVSYSLEYHDTQSQIRDWFEIDPNTGLVSVHAAKSLSDQDSERKIINCDVSSRIELIVRAKDGGQPPRSSKSRLMINILGVNDNFPTFDRLIYNVSIKEDLPAGTCFLQVLATDPDCGINSRIQYYISENETFDAFFTINPSTGTICLENSVDHEARTRYQFTVIAQDGGGLDSYSSLLIWIEDVNDNVPIFYPSAYNVSLRQTTPFNVPVVTVKATDADSGRFGMVRYKIGAETDEIHTFRVDPNTGDLFVNTYLSPTVYEVLISAVDGSEASSRTTAFVRITVIMNDYSSPVFDRRTYKTEVREDTLPGITIVQTRAFGLDPLIYSIQSGDLEGHFYIERTSGKISLNKYLDFEVKSKYLLNIQVASGNPPVYNNTQVQIDLEDSNDNKPVFEQWTSIITISEDFPIMTTLFTFLASDKDSGSNGEIRYRLLDNEEGRFLLHVLTGELKLAKPLDFERQRNHTLHILAIDNGIPPMSSNATLYIRVSDVNDHSPNLHSNNSFFELFENVPLMTEVGKVEAVDLDSGSNGRLSYKLLNLAVVTKANFSSTDYFGIYGNTGLIYTRKLIDRESFEEFSFIVLVRDNGRPSKIANGTVKIIVKDVNDNAPNCSAADFYVEENQRDNQTLGKIIAVDLDQGDNSRLNFTLLDDYKGQFKVDDLGNLFSERPLDRENIQDYPLKIRVADHGRPPLFSICSVFLHVTDVNDNSPFFMLPFKDNMRFIEQLPPGSEVFQAKAGDFDNGENGTIKYSLKLISVGSESNEINSLPFSIDPVSGLVTSRKAFHFETDSKIYNFYVVAVDGGKPPKTTKKSITLHIIPLVDGNQLGKNESVTFTLSEGTRLGSIVGKADAKLRDHSVDDRLDFEYSIISGNIFGIFDIERSTGTIFLIKLLDYEQQTSHVLTVNKRVIATGHDSAASLSGEISIVIRVIDENDNAPIFSENPLIFSLAENTLPNRIVWTVNATDKDSGAFSRLQYIIKEYSHEADEVFSLDHVTGDLYLRAYLDFERCTEYSLVVEAEDQAADVQKRLKSRMTIRIYVTDVNDNAPSFISQAKVYLFEDEPVGYPIVYVAATDPDWLENGRISYDLTTGNNERVFSLNSTTGLLAINRRLTRNDPRTFNLLVVAKDHGSQPLSSSQHLLVNVLNVNNDAPRFDQAVYKVEILENSAPGTPLVHLQAKGSHAGQNSNLLFYIATGDKDEVNSKFIVDEKTGLLSTKSRLDREDKQLFVLTVYVRDENYASKYDVASVVVTLLDENDNAPKIAVESCQGFSIPENRNFDELTTVIALDRDAGQNGKILYSIEGNLDKKFRIDAATGQLSCKSLDRELTSTYNLTIVANDNGYPKRLSDRCTISISVLDDNDNDPIFKRKLYTFEISEVSPLGSPIGQPIQATDKDQALNGLLSYNLINDLSASFDIDSRSGQIRLIRPLDYELNQNYSFRIESVDHGQIEQRRAFADVIVRVTDANDNPPVFERTPFTATLNDFVPSGQRITKVIATDVDGPGLNSDLYYGFVNETSIDKFAINPSTGVISAKGDLYLRPGSVSFLHIFASDKGHPVALKSRGVVQIFVTSKSLELLKPVITFEKEKYTVKVIEHAKFNKEIVEVQATGPVKNISYEIIAGNEDAIFSMKSQSGKISVLDRKNLDWEKASLRRLLVKATANFQTEPGSEANTAYVEVIANLEDSNDHAPQFVQQRYYTSIREGMSRGTFVAQVSATDQDADDASARITYSIVNGNLDSAFIVDGNGIFRTNAELDREIVDHYLLTVSAADFGSPTQTSNAILDIQVNDVNDNSPSFPFLRPIKLSEGSTIGTYVTTVQANDVDSYPPLVYSFTSSGNPDNIFAINAFSGRIILLKPLDFEKQEKHTLEIQVSDDLHVASSKLDILLMDENDNAPVFAQQFYQISIPVGAKMNTSVGQVKATDADSGENGLVSYQLRADDSTNVNLWIDSSTGMLCVNDSVTSEMDQWPVSELSVQASDHGKPPKFAFASVHVQIVSKPVEDRGQFTEKFYRFSIPEDAPLHSKIGKLTTNPESVYSIFTILQETVHFSYSLNQTFFIDSEGNIILLQRLDRETKDLYNFIVELSYKSISPPDGSNKLTTCSVSIIVEDVNDNAPEFDHLFYEITIDDVIISDSDTPLLKLNATDKDVGDNGLLSYELSSGDGADAFFIDSEQGFVTIKNKTALERDDTEKKRFVVKVSDNGNPSRSSFTYVDVKFAVKNKMSIFFPLSLYLGRIFENEQPGSGVILTANALCSGSCNKSVLNFRYALSGEDASLFKIDSKSGELYSTTTFDYEVRTSYNITVHVYNIGNQSALTYAQILIKGRDEFSPVFSQASYEFRVDFQTNVGDMAGAIYATDRDHGLDGQISFALKKSNTYFAISPETGTVLVTRSLIFFKNVMERNSTRLSHEELKHLFENQVDLENRRIHLEIVAYSGSDVNSGRVNETFADILLGDYNPTSPTSGQINSLTGSIITVTSVLLVVLAIIIMWVLWRVKCKLEYHKPSSENKISYPKKIMLDDSIYRSTILSDNDRNRRLSLKNRKNSHRKVDIVSPKLNNNSLRTNQISAEASDKFVCECDSPARGGTLRLMKRTQNLTSVSNCSTKSSFRDSVIIADNEEPVDTEDEVFRHVTQKICESENLSRCCPDHPSDSGIHLYSSEHDDVDGSLNSEEYPSAREYLSNLGITPTKNCRIIDQSKKATLTNVFKVARAEALEAYLDQQDIVTDGIDVRELIYSKISEVLADEHDTAGQSSRNLPDVTQFQGPRLSASKFKTGCNEFPKPSTEGSERMTGSFRSQTGAWVRPGHKNTKNRTLDAKACPSVHWSTRKASLPTPSPVSPDGKIVAKQGLPQSPKFVYPSRRTISPLPVPQICTCPPAPDKLLPTSSSTVVHQKPFMVKMTRTEDYAI